MQPCKHDALKHSWLHRVFAVALHALLAALSSSCSRFKTSARGIDACVPLMNTRLHAAVLLCREGSSCVISTLCRLSTSARAAVTLAHASGIQSLSKAADDTDSVVSIVDAVVAMTMNQSTSGMLLISSIAPMCDAAHQSQHDWPHLRLPLLVPIITAPSFAVPSMSRVWHELPESACSTILGTGIQCFVTGAHVTTNEVFVVPRIVSGELAAYVTPADVHVEVTDEHNAAVDASIAISRNGDDGIHFSYALSDESLRQIVLRVSVCGVCIGPPTKLLRAYHWQCDESSGGSVVACCDLGSASKAGLALTPDGNMVISLPDANAIHVYRTVPHFECIHAFGTLGDGPAQFNVPCRLCIADDNTILVCDYYNNRVQQLTLTGTYLCSIHVSKPYSVAAHRDIVAIGSVTCGPIELYSLQSHDLIRVIGSRGVSPGLIAEFVTGMCFSADGNHIFVAEASHCRVSMFAVTGAFLRLIQEGVPSVYSETDVACCASGDLLVSDMANHRICVYSADGAGLQHILGSRGTAPGLFVLPKALVVSGPRLYVLDNTRVQVFE